MGGGGPGVVAHRKFAHGQVVTLVLLGKLCLVGGVAAALDDHLHIRLVDEFIAVVVQLGGELHRGVFGEHIGVAHAELALVALGSQVEHHLVNNLVEGLMVFGIKIVV